jgi:mannose-1-phosphate guanylyltransferase
MKAFLLAAGLGTRLRPLTDTVPKCLVPIAGRPLLAYWLALLERHGFEEVLINLHHLPDQVRQFAKDARSRVRLTLVEEPVLLGSAGTVRVNREHVSDGRPFLVAYADNLTNADLSALMDAHTRHRPLLTMALFRTEEPTRCGIAELRGEAGGEILTFVEKPTHPRSNLANAGLYVADARVIERIPTHVPADFGHDVLPGLVGHMRGELLRGDLIDVGTNESYARAQAAAGRLGLLAPTSAEVGAPSYQRVWR